MTAEVDEPSVPAGAPKSKKTRRRSRHMEELLAEERRVLQLEIAEERRARETEFRQLRQAIEELQGRKPSQSRARHSSSAVALDLAQIPSGESPAGPGASPTTEPEPAPEGMAVTGEGLDAGDSYSLNASLWDVSTFVGHPCLGSGVSVVLCLAYLLNVGLQLFFCYIVYRFMLEPPIDGQALESLLRFRVGIGHNVQFADTIAEESLTAQVCRGEKRLVLAGGQVSMAGDLAKFQKGGEALMVLVIVLWLSSSLKEINSTWSFGRAMLRLHRSSKSTTLIFTDSDSLEEESLGKNLEETLARLSIVTRLKSITMRRLVAVFAFIVVPRMMVAVIHGFVGVRWLGQTSSMQDLVLNAVALAFVSEIDELLFEIFVPRRAVALMSNLEPLSVPRSGTLQVPWGHVLVKMALLVAAVVGTYLLTLSPFFWMLAQAQSVLCSGEKDFVFAENAASGILHVARSMTVNEWTPHEKIVLQVAKPQLEAKHGWNIDDELLRLSRADSMPVVVMPEAADIRDASHEHRIFQAVRYLGSASVEEAAQLLACKDLGAGLSNRASLVELREALNNDRISNCSQVPWQACAEYNMSQVRALCPMRCNCHKPLTYAWAYTGHFNGPGGGCPTQCAALLASFSEIRYATGSADSNKGAYFCEDVGDDEFTFSDSCAHTDQFQNPPSRNKEGYSCSAIARLELSCSSQSDDDDFTASLMCCSCGGGSTDVKSSLQCLDHLTDSCRNMNLPAFWFFLYVRGLFQRLLADQFFSDAVHSIVTHPSRMVGSNRSNQAGLVRHVTSGAMAQSLLDGEWNLMPGLRHPRGLRGCQFLTSFEFKALIGVDVCNSQEFASIKFLCPTSCGCTPHMYLNEEGTYSDISSMFAVFSGDRTDLSECPASCVLPHPSSTGDLTWNDYPDDDHHDYHDSYDDEGSDD